MQTARAALLLGYNASTRFRIWKGPRMAAKKCSIAAQTEQYYALFRSCVNDGKNVSCLNDKANVCLM
jgi:hypothetical protein